MGWWLLIILWPIFFSWDDLDQHDDYYDDDMGLF